MMLLMTLGVMDVRGPKVPGIAPNKFTVLYRGA